MLLIDEIDRADDEFEAFLLELLSDFQVTIPEIGTITCKARPVVFLTSNRTRELHEALKRRCLYMWVPHPELDREIEIVRAPRARRAGAAGGGGRARSSPSCARSTSRRRRASPRRSTGRRR